MSELKVGDNVAVTKQASNRYGEKAKIIKLDNRRHYNKKSCVVEFELDLYRTRIALEYIEKIDSNATSNEVAVKDKPATLNAYIRENYSNKAAFAIAEECEDLSYILSVEMDELMTYQDCVNWIRGNGDVSTSYKIVFVASISESPKIQAREIRAL